MPRTALVGAAHAQAAGRVWTLVRALYAYNLVIAIDLAHDWQRWQQVPALDPLWPVRWVEGVGIARGATGVLLGHLGISLLTVLKPESRFARLLCVAGALPTFALQSSFGKVNHGYHALLWVMMILVFLPRFVGPTSGSRHDRRTFDQRTLRVFWAAQAALLMFYSMSGGLKLYASIRQLAAGQVSFLSPSGAAHHIAHRLLQTQGDSLLGAFVIEHAWLGGPTQWLTLYLEMLAFVVAFRPAAHRLWAIGLIAMHLGIGLCMNIWFVYHMGVVALVLGCSPFTRDGTSLTDGLGALPGVAALRSRLR